MRWKLLQRNAVIYKILTKKVCRTVTGLAYTGDGLIPLYAIVVFAKFEDFIVSEEEGNFSEHSWSL